MKKEKLQHSKEIFPTVLSNIKAVINEQRYTDGSVRLSGYLADARTGIRLDQDISGNIKVRTFNQIPDKRRILIARLTASYQQATTTRPTVALSSTPYTQAYNALSPAQRQQVLSPTWRAESTRRQALAYYVGTFLPLLDTYGLALDAEDAHAIVADLQRTAEQHGNHAGNTYTTQRTTIRHAQQCNYMYQAMRRMLPDYALPDLMLPVPARPKSIQSEQCKALSLDIRIKLATALLTLIPNGLAMGGILMMTSMLRTAEACAPRFGDILFSECYAVYGVIWQTQGGLRIADLKNDSSYRPIILPQYAVDALRLRMTWLRNRGYTEEQISAMPVVSTPNDPTTMADPKALSSYIRQILIALGYNDEFWAAVDTLMQTEPDHDEVGTGVLMDPTAYLLRRAGCTLYCNVGLDPHLVDALMGHKIKNDPDNWISKIRRPDCWSEIAAQMARAVFHPQHSNHPLISPIQLTTEYLDPATLRAATQVSQLGYRFQAVPDVGTVEIRITLESCEPGAPITASVTFGNISDVSSSATSAPERDWWALGHIEPPEVYMEFVHEAGTLDFTPFLPNI